MRVGLLLFVLAALVLGACAKDGKTGACEGFEDGTYFRLELNNYNQVPIEIRVNGRFVGSVPAAIPTPSTPGAVSPGYKQLGEFPICDHTEIDYAGQNITSQKVCATSALTSPACSATRLTQGRDFCFISIAPIPGPDFPVGSDLPNVSSPICDPTPPDPCANTILYNVGSC